MGQPSLLAAARLVWRALVGGLSDSLARSWSAAPPTTAVAPWRRLFVALAATPVMLLGLCREARGDDVAAEAATAATATATATAAAKATMATATATAATATATTTAAAKATTATATATAEQSGAAWVEGFDIDGISRTRGSTILELLPRQPPAAYTDAELVEIERRIDNLAIFDEVSVARRGARVRVQVREKWTLIPSFDFASGKTLADSYAMLGLTEYNTLGTASQTGLSVYREQRGWGVAGWFGEHSYRRERWSFGGEGYLDTKSYRFEDGNGWRTTTAFGAIELTSPPSLSQWINQKLGVSYTRETIDEVRGGARPPNSHAVQTFVGLSWDRYRWKDLVPRGLKGEVSLGVGVLAGPPVFQPRHSVDATVVGAVPLGKTTVLTARVSGSARTRGNAVFSSLLGSIQGVRGLEDSLYRNWVQGYANVELRQSFPVARRWALQAVAFVDAAAFERIAAAGGRGAGEGALGFGAGGRLVPTWLASVVLRADVARLVFPTPRWFLQVGLSQYF